MAVAGPRCLYCGAALPKDVVTAAARDVEAAPREVDAGYVVLDLEGADPARVADALGLGAYDAAQRIRRGLQLHRVAPEDETRAEAERLLGLGLAAIAIPGAEVREAARPRRATRGRLEATRLVATTEQGTEIAAADLLLLVHGAIERRHQGPRPQIKWGAFRFGSEFGLPTPEVATATLETGHRYHLYFRDEIRPVEIDPAAFALEGDPAESVARRLAEWAVALAATEPVDDGFRRVPPVFGPAADATATLGALRAVRAPRSEAPKDGERVILDTLAQFRTYSGWRAAAARRRAR